MLLLYAELAKVYSARVLIHKPVLLLRVNKLELLIPSPLGRFQHVQGRGEAADHVIFPRVVVIKDFDLELPVVVGRGTAQDDEVGCVGIALDEGGGSWGRSGRRQSSREAG